ncbi:MULTISPECIES: nuclear transport factor 2 family protein [Pseudomonas]|uniref:Nuclear transport factor 2 family protein n=1 Tax=Pseudomonas mosselii TaxID=78327 RepID=A0A7W2JTA6_9PSED|nr:MULTISPECIES: nuclear transport factor 2 family protein [Pseudomonas]MBA6064771.1 nuclear transport factor 2 family protein [Pseudomonas mosselii]MBC3457042.1 nuclear transport factor 2 family protein [Pseudomonas mosselii]MBH3312566.1 nuclear transport factor 2 family protein [Pseudomonas mosselii]MBH3327502.1 nuclear transport factor 2 family protein [Pseudomonas mosselii]MCH7417904.1 nuclear transport factor 2 family protein [Pseudomonas mosselii]
MKKPNPCPKAISRYVKGWTRRDAELLASAFSRKGIYVDSPHPMLDRKSLPAFLRNVSWRNFPDMTFDTLGIYGDGQRFTWEWVMHVTGSGVIAGSENKKIAVPGVDLLEMKGNKIRRAMTYFDRKALWDAVLS